MFPLLYTIIDRNHFWLAVPLVRVKKCFRSFRGKLPSPPDLPPQPPHRPRRHHVLWSKQDESAKGTRRQADDALLSQDYSILVCLSLSDYALWSNSDLRRTLVSGNDGFLPISYLFHHSPFLSALEHLPAETIVVKSIRTYADDYLDVRMRVSAPSSSTWHRQNAAEELGGYEVRRKSWQAALKQARHLSKLEWDNRTVYLENIPLKFRTVPAIYTLTNFLITGASSSTNPAEVVQHIWLPPHHQDHSGDRPKCKGFALVTFAQHEYAECLLQGWPWDPRRKDLGGFDLVHVTEAQEAINFGFRTLPRTRWIQLNEEYRTYRQKLLDVIAHADEGAAQQNFGAYHSTGRHVVIEDHPSLAAAPVALAVDHSFLTAPMDLSAPFPRGCLVFVRNVHPESNKTTLRALFSQMFSAWSPDEKLSGGVDYVDFNKGMDSCYLRLTNPRHTQILATFFAENIRIQMQGLDTSGDDSSTSSRAKAITVEVVDGTREELYWNKVPEKVRREAVERAVKCTSGNAINDDSHDAPQNSHGARKRKRRKLQS
ncbi:uncharacterized protein FIBRA_05470 [Fibroporia radiculosa]|uniref:XRRM domain-containing protein n=1 Tax=Fibroporia radiculosa TaxID=599839 RepID=J4IAQ9_9APHY|nr:uncharacterized protein FIBRA_05470 [Fibroporia radiculosa]CCM03341.1 predicted protein [Fibroporia radiculosa]